jgi:hypothetical protein
MMARRNHHHRGWPWPLKHPKQRQQQQQKQPQEQQQQQHPKQQQANSGQSRQNMPAISLQTGATVDSNSSTSYDQLRDLASQIKQLERERDSLKEQVLTLAYCNHAREPEFVRDRTKLRELTRSVAQLVKHLNSKHIEPIVSKLKLAQGRLAQAARRHEEESELVAQRFLESTTDSTKVQQFTNDYIEIRKEAIKKRTLADRLAKELDALSGATNVRIATTAGSGGGGGSSGHNNSVT